MLCTEQNRKKNQQINFKLIYVLENDVEILYYL